MGKTFQKGFTIVEIIVAIGLVTFLSGAALSFASYARKDIGKQEALAARNTEQGIFFNMLSQPSYVGALAEYEKNIALRKCLDTDGEICEIKKDYPLTAFNLESGELQTAVDSNSSHVVKNDFSFQVHCPLNQAACDQVDYLTVKIRSSIIGDNGVNFTSDKTVVVQPRRSNVISIVPNTKLENGSPVNVIIILDGSNSMSGIKDSFKMALQKLIDSLKKLDAKVAIYPLQRHIWPNTGPAYILDAMGNKKYITYEEKQAMAGGESRYEDVTWLLNTGSPYYTKYGSTQTSSLVYSFKSDMTDSDRQITASAIEARIDRIFLDMGAYANRDAGLCGILRLLDQEEQGIGPFKMASTTPTVLMVLTNEDDESVLLKPGATFPGAYTLDPDYMCAKGVTQKWTKEYGKVAYYVDKFIYKVAGSQEVIVDGAPFTKTFTNASLTFIKYRDTHVVGADCLSDANGVDKTDVTSSLKHWGYISGSNSNYTLTSCKIELQSKALVGYAAEGAHPCLTLPGSYPYMVPGTCTEKDVPSSSMGWSGAGGTVLGYYVPTDTEAHATGSLPTAIHNLLKSKFNPGNFLLSLVINPKSGICPATPGSAEGLKYEALASKLGSNAQVIPICSSDYDAKILDIAKKLDTLGLNDFTLPSGLGNRLSGVDVLRGSVVLPATEGADYTRNGDLVVFTSGFLLPTDVVRFYLK